MAINTRKISGLTELSQIDGNEYIMLAKNNRSYKAKSSLFTSDKIESITQTEAKGDGAVSNINITTSAGDNYVFTVRNGSTGSDGQIGPTGKKGETGDSGVILYNTDMNDIIVDNLEGKSNDGTEVYTDNELSSFILSARQGNILNGKIEALAEQYLTQDEYDSLVENNAIKDHVKYFIIEEE